MHPGKCEAGRNHPVETGPGGIVFLFFRLERLEEVVPAGRSRDRGLRGGDHGIEQSRIGQAGIIERTGHDSRCVGPLSRKKSH
jgi:hypothetical protein